MKKRQELKKLDMRIGDYLKLFRFKHWLKNGFVILPIFFAQQMDHNYFQAIIGFVLFSLTASAVYIFNDFLDKDLDKLNPKKVNYFAERKLSTAKGAGLMFLLVNAALIIGLQYSGWTILLTYLALNFVYSLGLKNIPYLELLFIVAGFILRIVYGSLIVGVPITNWLYAEVALLTGLIIVSKRYKELQLFNRSKVLSRKVLKFYDEGTLKLIFVLVEIALLTIYCWYCFDAGVMQRMGTNIWITIPIAVLGLIQFSRLTFLDGDIYNPIALLVKDKLIQVIIVAWIVTWGILIYG